MTAMGVLFTAVCVACVACELPEEQGDVRVSSAIVGAPGVIASLQLPNGALVEFIDTFDGRVAVGERAPRNQRFRSSDLMLAWNATPLEIFLALAPPGTSAPAALLADHELHMRASGASGAAPRSLAQSVSYGVGDPGVEDFECDGTGFVYATAWHDAFDGVTTNVEVEAKHHFSTTRTFYPGNGVYYGTNTNSITYLGACNGDAAEPLGVLIQRRIKWPNPPAVIYVWVEVAQVTLDPSQKYTFASAIPASYREHLWPATNGAVIMHAQAGGAWTPSPVISAP